MTRLDGSRAAPRHHDILGIGFGPSNLALAIAIAEANRRRRDPLGACFVERQPGFAWHADMMLPGADMQISFVKDLVTLRDPTSPFSFLNYLHEKGRLSAFLNLKTFHPSRIEFNDYLGWAAGRLAGDVAYGETVERVDPILTPAGIVGFRVDATSRDGEPRRRVARHLVVAPGGRPRVPAVFAGVDDPRLIHASRYLSAIDAALGGAGPARRVAVVGAGQSAVEIAVDAGRRFPAMEVDLVFRAHALRPADDSAFANAIFDPDAVDMVYGLPRPRRSEVLGSLRQTNYAAVDADLIAHLHALVYDERVRDERRYRICGDTEVAGVCAGADGIALTLRNRRDGSAEARRYDAVVLGTGYDRTGLPDVLGPLAPHVAGAELARDYSLPLHRAAGATIHLQGWSEASHGLSDTLLSLVSVRAGEIVASLEAAQGAAEAPGLSRVGAR